MNVPVTVAVAVISLSARAGPSPSAPETREVGAMKVWMLRDGYTTLEASLLSGTSPAEVSARLGGRNAVRTPINAFLVKAGGKTILVDSGAGKVPDEDTGHLREELARAGVDPSDVDVVLVTHFHLDHVGGLLAPDGTRAFPRAVLRVPRSELDAWLDERAQLPERMKDRPRLLRAIFAPYQAAGAFRPIEAGEVVAPGVGAVAAHGHTGGHTVFAFGSGDRGDLWCIGDLVHFGDVQFARPDAGVSLDVDGNEALAARRRILREAAANGAVVAGVHLAHLVRLEPSGDGGYSARALPPVTASDGTGTRPRAPESSP